TNNLPAVGCRRQSNVCQLLSSRLGYHCAVRKCKHLVLRGAPFVCVALPKGPHDHVERARDRTYALSRTDAPERCPEHIPGGTHRTSHAPIRLAQGKQPVRKEQRLACQALGLLNVQPLRRPARMQTGGYLRGARIGLGIHDGYAKLRAKLADGAVAYRLGSVQHEDRLDNAFLHRIAHGLLYTNIGRLREHDSPPKRTRARMDALGEGRPHIQLPANLSRRACCTSGCTNGLTSPPKRATSRTRLELTYV